jgi:hypothetical protein
MYGEGKQTVNNATTNAVSGQRSVNSTPARHACGGRIRPVNVSATDFTLRRVTLRAAVGLYVFTPSDLTLSAQTENVTEARVVGALAPDQQVADALLATLSYAPRELPQPAWSGPDHTRATKHRRRTLLSLFGVERTSDWLAEARYVGIGFHNGMIRLHPSRRYSATRESFIGLSEDQSVYSLVDDSSQIARTIRDALQRCR